MTLLIKDKHKDDIIFQNLVNASFFQENKESEIALSKEQVKKYASLPFPGVTKEIMAAHTEKMLSNQIISKVVNDHC